MAIELKKATVARNQKSIRWQNEEEKKKKTGSVIELVLLWPMNEQCMIIIQAVYYYCNIKPYFHLFFLNIDALLLITITCHIIFIYNMV